MHDRVFDDFDRIVERPRAEWAELACKAFPTDDNARDELERMLAVAAADFGTDPFDREGDAQRALLDKLGVIEVSSDEAPPLLPGIQLFEEVGRGSSGIVYRGVQAAPISRDVAVKVFHRDSGRSAHLRREAGMLSRLNHPGVAMIHDVGVASDGRAYAVLEFIKGVPITRMLRATPQSLQDTLRIFGQVCDAVAHAAERGIVHRDLKPANILASGQTGSIQIKVLDFSIAGGITAEEDRSLTLDGLVVGTPEYMSPEQADPSLGPTSTRSDVYALGVMLYEILVGCHPYAPDPSSPPTLLSLLNAIKASDPIRPSVHRSMLTKQGRIPPTALSWSSRELTGDLDAIVLKAMSQHPEARYADARDLLHDVSRWLSRESISARMPGAAEQLVRAIRRRPAASAASAALLLGLLATSTVVGISNLRLTAARTSEAKAHADTRLTLASSALQQGDAALAQIQLDSVPDAFRDSAWSVVAASADQSLSKFALDQQGIAAIEQHGATTLIAGESGRVWALSIDEDSAVPTLIAEADGRVRSMSADSDGNRVLIRTESSVREIVEGIQVQRLAQGSAFTLSDDSEPLSDDHRDPSTQSDNASLPFEFSVDTAGVLTVSRTDNPLVRTRLRGHTGGVRLPTGEMVSPRHRFATGGYDGTVRIWEVESPLLRTSSRVPWQATAEGWIELAVGEVVLPGITDQSNSIVSIDDETGSLLSVSGTPPAVIVRMNDGVLRFAGVQPSGASLQRDLGHPVFPLARPVRTDNLIWYASTPTVLVRENLISGESRTASTANAPIFALAASVSDDALFAVVGTEASRFDRSLTRLHLFDVPSGTQFLATSRDYVVTATINGAARVMDLRDSAVESIDLGGGIRTLNILAASDLALVGTVSGEIRIVDLSEKRVVASVPLLSRSVASTSFGASGLIRIAGADGEFTTLRLRRSSID